MKATKSWNDREVKKLASEVLLPGNEAEIWLHLSEMHRN